MNITEILQANQSAIRIYKKWLCETHQTRSYDFTKIINKAKNKNNKAKQQNIMDSLNNDNLNTF
jgi:hypothetical protein